MNPVQQSFIQSNKISKIINNTSILHLRYLQQQLQQTRVKSKSFATWLMQYHWIIKLVYYSGTLNVD